MKRRQTPITHSPVHWLIFLCGLIATSMAAEPKPLMQAHAHNDYEHARPLLDALDHGFGSIEADVWLVEGRLLVAHDLKNVKPERTLSALYLEPLRERVAKNAGRVYRGGSSVVLLVDVKSEAVTTYAALQVVLKDYAAMLTAFRGAAVEERAVTVILSGNRATKEIAAQALRFVAVDGRSGDLETNPPATLVPLISDNWQKLFQWRWVGAMPTGERAKLDAFVARAHAQGRKVRFWNTPDRPEAWRLLRDARVDVIGTDNLGGLAKFFAEGRQ